MFKKSSRAWLAGIAVAALAPFGFGEGDDTAAWAAFAQATPPAFSGSYLANGTANQTLEVFVPPGTPEAGKLRPVLILVHGGGWTSGTRDTLAPHARYFAASGWVCVNISYRLAGEAGATLPDAQADVRAALGWVRSQAAQRGWDPARISALGESAGGQLVCALGILPPTPESWRVHSLVLVNPILDLTTLTWALTVPGLRDAGPVNPATAAQHPAGVVSPMFFLTREAPPVLLLQGRKDVTVPVAQAEAFAARAKREGASVDLVVYENSAHAFLLREYGRPDEIRPALQRIAAFLGQP